MSDDDDQVWLDALAGRAGAASPTAREAQSLRAALRKHVDLAARTTPPATPDTPGLLERAAREGLIAQVPRRVPRWALPLAASVLVVFAVGLFVRLDPPATQEVQRGEAAEVVRLEAADPAGLKSRILTALRGAGVEATGYEALDVHGIDADLPRPVSPELRRVLEQFSIPEPADGVLRIEIRKSP